jgi:hypothetical protein
MLTSYDYKRLADRSARLAIECPAPSVAEALMALALDYSRRAASLSRAGETDRYAIAPEPLDGYGD